MKSRFAEAEANRSPTTPRSSRFKEEFDDTLKSDADPPTISPVTPSSTPRRRSTRAKDTLTRLAKRAVGSYDGPMEKMLGVPLVSPQPLNRSSTRSPVSPLEDTEVLGAWGKAVKNVKSQRKESSTNLDRGKSNWRRPSFKTNKSEEDDESGTKISKFAELMAQKDELMDDWELEMERTAQKAKSKSKKMMQKVKSGPDLRFPPSWAKFPTHGREERVLNVDNFQGVDTKDFAVHEEKDGKTIWYQNERKYHDHHFPGDDHESHKNEVKKGFFRKLEDKFKDQLPTRDDEEMELIEDQTYGRRGSTFLGLDPEFPELEILPIEIMSAAEIEEHVEEHLAQEELNRMRELARIKREAEEEELRQKEEELDAIFGGRKKKRVNKESPIYKARMAAEEAKKARETDEGESPHCVSRVLLTSFRRTRKLNNESQKH